MKIKPTLSIGQARALLKLARAGIVAGQGRGDSLSNEEAGHPLRAYRKAVAHDYGDDEAVVLAPYEARSKRAHDHFFAVVDEAHQTLPDDLAERFPSPDHLRKWALIKTGHYDSRSVVCGSKADAARVAAFVRPLDEYAVVVASEAVVTVYTAKSQSLKAMGRKLFQESKADVLDLLAELLGVTVEQLSKSSEGPDRANNPAGAAA